MKKITLLLIAAAAVIFTFTAEKMSESGKAGYTSSPGELDCTDCHNTYALNAGGGSVVLTSTNMTGWMYDPGVTYHMVATVTRSGNPLFGICVEALTTANDNAGTMVITNTTATKTATKTVGGIARVSVVHKLNGGLTSGSHAFTFDWTAPANNIGNVTFYFTGAACNANGDEFGDYIYQGSQVVSYNTGIGITNINRNSTIGVYPMPVQDHFTMNYEVKSTGTVKINLYNMQGSLVANLASKVMSTGNYNDNFYLPAQLSAGNYILSVESESGVSSRKILIN